MCWTFVTKSLHPRHGAGMRASLLLLILCTFGASGKKKDENPIDKIESVPGFDLSRFAGKWYLHAVSSECDYLKTNNHRVEATVLQATPSKNWRKEDVLAVSTYRKLDGICWEIKHEYKINTKVKGRFSFKVGGYGGDAEVVVAATDYQNYAILYYQRRKKITIKLYGRKPSASDNASQMLDDRVSKQGIDLEYIYWFPTYGFCEKADQFHILNGSKIAILADTGNVSTTQWIMGPTPDMDEVLILQF